MIAQGALAAIVQEVRARGLLPICRPGTNVSSGKDKHGVKVDWTTVVPLGDTLSINADGAFDDRWVEAFEVVLDEHERQATDAKWGGIDFEYDPDDKAPKFVLLVKKIQPEVKAHELRRTVDDLVKAANTVAQVGTHVYELARELRQPEAAAPQGSTPPPSFDPLDEALQADAA
jgi:hypothetical protein